MVTHLVLAGGMSNELPYSFFQNEIYLNGWTQGAKPILPTNLLELEQAAKEQLDPQAYGYVAGAAGTGRTHRANREAFDDWNLIQRVFVDVEKRDWSTNILGTDLPAPLLLGPVGVQTIVHPEGELASAKAAAAAGIPFIHSTAATHSIEQVGQANGDGPRWYQLYWPREREVAASFVQRAEAAGYSALVVTLDTFMMGWRPTDLDTAYLPFLQGKGIQNYLTDPAFMAGVPEGSTDDVPIFRWSLLFGNPTLTWDDLPWLREQTKLPIILKGVISADDAKHARDAGVDGLICSNHGGRQLDGGVAALRALPELVAAVDGSMPVLFDSGIRSGADMLKALALGAAAVLLGRTYVYGLGLAGQAGVEHVIRTLLGDFDVSAAMAGVTNLSEVNREILRPSNATR